MSNVMTDVKEFVQIPPRPTRHDPDIVRLVAIKLADDALREHIIESEQYGSTLDDFTKVLDHSWGYDGYRLAKTLDDWFHWDCDLETVELLNMAAIYIHEVYRDAVKGWVKQFEITPHLQVGQIVTWPKPPMENGHHTGEITQILADTAEYVVFCEDEGHIRPGTGSGSLGHIVAYEKVEQTHDH